MEHHEDLHLIVVSPESTLFDGNVDIVILPGESGSFSVLHDHAPLISSLLKGEIKYTEDGLEKSIGISIGFVEVRDCLLYTSSGAGIISSDFNLQQLLEFAKDYHPNRDFVYWVRGAEYTLSLIHI